MKKSGFTMVELLATIIILGLLTSLAYIGIRAILDRGYKSYYESQENMLLLAGKEYFADYREKLPKEIGKTASVTLKTLINEAYIDPIKDKNEKECNQNESSVIVQKITEKDYQYYLSLKCDDYLTTKDEAKPVIVFNPNKKSTTKPITVTMKITDNKEVKSYRYVITKDGEVYKDSDYQIYNGDITIKLKELGLYEITGYAIDSSGNKASKTSGKYSIYKGIDCSLVTISSDTKKETWSNKNINITIKLPDNTYKWELSEKINGGNYSALNNYIGFATQKIALNKDGKHKLKLTLYDRDGNSCIVTTEEYYVDKTAPSCTSSGGSSSWTTKNITLKGTCKDEGGSGCAGNVTKLYDSDTSLTNQSPGVVKDKAGNTTTCPANQTVKIDKTPPSCTSSGGSSSWTNNDIILTGTCKDKDGSGCASNVTKTYSNEGTWTKQSPGVVKDNVGNTTTCPANQTVKIDKTAPSCTSSGGSSSWTNKNITLTGTCKDEGGSGCVGNVTKTFSNETSLANQSPGVVKDKAGNTTTCPANQTVKIDKTAPSCPSIDSTTSTNTWTNQDITFTFGFTSDTSKYLWNTGSVSSLDKSVEEWKEEGYYRSPSETTAKLTQEGYRAIRVIVYDAAGNSKECFTNRRYYIDKTPPTITYGRYSGATEQSILYISSSGQRYNFYYSDSLSGLATDWYAYTITGECDSGWKKAGDTLCPSGSAPYWRAYKVMDNAGNYSNVVCSYTTEDSITKGGPGTACEVEGKVFFR